MSPQQRFLLLLRVLGMGVVPGAGFARPDTSRGDVPPRADEDP
jgi:hypothetical protein